MKLLKTTIISIVILVPLAWGIILFSTGSFLGTIESIFLDSFILPIIFGCVALVFIIKGVKETLEQKKFNNNISVGVLFAVIAVGALLYIIKTAW